MQQDVTRFNRTQTEQGFNDFRTLGTDQTGHTQNLAFVQIEGNVLNRWLIQCGQTFDLKNRFCRFIGFRWETMRQITTNHQADDFVGGQIFGSLSRDPLTIAHHRHIVSNFQNFFHLVRDVDDANTALFECVNDAEQMRHFFLSQ